jgi:hypothetical protein
LHDLVEEQGISLLQGPSGATSLTTGAQPEFRRGWKWLRSWAVKDGVTVSNQVLKSLYETAVTASDPDALKSLLGILKDEVAAAL